MSEDKFYDACSLPSDDEFDYEDALEFITNIQNATPVQEGCSDYREIQEIVDTFPVDEEEKKFSYEEIMEVVENVKKASNFKCGKCTLEFQSQQDRDTHEDKGHVRKHAQFNADGNTTLPSCSFYECTKCKRRFPSRQERNIHEQNCNSGSSQTSISSPSTLSSNTSVSNIDRQKMMKCRKCKVHFRGRQALAYHQMAAHHIGLGNLQPFPWGQNDPFSRMDGGDEMRQVYMHNSPVILSPHLNEDRVKQIFNFPINEHISEEDLESHLEYIFAQQSSVFKFQLTFGVILEQLLDDGERRVRYFKPAANLNLLDEPISVWNRWSLMEAIRTLNEIDLNEKVREFRPNSKYKVRFITQVQYSVYVSDQLLGARITLPDFIKNKKCILTRTTDSRGREYQENLCFFTALAQYLKKQEGHASFYNVIPESIHLLEQWYRFLCENNFIDNVGFRQFKDNFQGVSHEDFECLEQCFQVSINTFQLTSKDESNVIYLSSKTYSKQIYLNEFQNHVNLITDFKVYAQKYVCSICQKILKTKQALKRHGVSCLWKTKFIFPGGYYKYSTSLFEDMEEVGVFVPEELRCYPYFAVWDMEAMLEKIPDSGEGKLKYTHIHKAVSCSIASNIPGHEEAYCVVNENTQELVSSMFNKFEMIWETAVGLSYARWGVYLDHLKRKMYDLEQLISSRNRRDNQNNEREEGKQKDKLSPEECLYFQLNKLKQDLERYMHQLVILSFNGSRYDTNLIRSCLSHYLYSNAEEGERSEIEIRDEGGNVSLLNVNVPSMGKPKIIKRGKKYLLIANTYYRFLDIINYLPPGTSYAGFLKSFEIEEQKFFFPYEFLTSYNKLNQTFLPPYPSEGWFSSLKSRDLLNYEFEQWEVKGKKGPPPKSGIEYYQMIKDTWDLKGWRTMKDYLIYYNNCDTIPFVKAVNKLREMYRIQNVDIFKQTISVPGVARIRLMSHAKESGVLFSLFDKKNRDLYFMFRSQLVAGPSIIFTRYQEKDITPLRPEDDNICKSIYGYDVNSLYLYCIGGEMPTGDVVRRFASDQFTPRYNTRYSKMYNWMKFMEIEDRVEIRSLVTNGKEARVGKYFVDGMALLPNSKIRIYEFHGCYWHKHPCARNSGARTEEDCKKYQETLEREEFFRRVGFELTSVWECEFDKMKKDNPLIPCLEMDFLSPFTQKNRKGVTEADIIQGIMDGTLVGFILADIEVPEDLRHYYKDFPPLFANHNINLSDIGKFPF